MFFGKVLLLKTEQPLIKKKTDGKEQLGGRRGREGKGGEKRGDEAIQMAAEKEIDRLAVLVCEEEREVGSANSVKGGLVGGRMSVRAWLRRIWRVGWRRRWLEWTVKISHGTRFRQVPIRLR